jgi:hypothetical protein
MRLRGLCSGTGFCAIILAAALAGASAEERRDGSGNMTPRQTQPGAPGPDLSPLPNFKGDFIAMGANGVWNIPPKGRPMLGAGMVPTQPPAPDCSPEAIVHFAMEAPAAFEADKSGRLYGVQTHTPATRVTTRYWDMPGYNSCALVVYAILKRAGCGWARYTADAKGIYDQAYQAGWKASDTQEGGCMVAWNSRWDGGRARIGDRQKQSPRGGTRFRHVGIATGRWMSVDNSSWQGRPTRFFTFRPIIYETPIFLCPPSVSVQQDKPSKN